MPGDLWLWLGLGALALISLALLAAALLSGRVDPRTTASGARNGLLIALVIGLLVVLPVAFLAHGQRLAGSILDWPAALALGLLIGLPLSVGYFWLGAVLMVGGLFLGADRAWAMKGAWLVAPVAAIVFLSAGGLALAMAQRAGEPMVATRPGQLQLNLERAGRPLALSGPALCELSSAGTFEILAGEGGVPALAGPDGEELAIELAIHEDFPVLLTIRAGEWVAYSGTGWQLSPQTVGLSPGWTRRAGELAFSGLRPLDPASGQPRTDEEWQGSLAWNCAD